MGSDPLATPPTGTRPGRADSRRLDTGCADVVATPFSHDALRSLSPLTWPGPSLSTPPACGHWPSTSKSTSSSARWPPQPQAPHPAWGSAPLPASSPENKTPSRLLADWLRLPSGHPSGDVCTQDRRDPRRRCAHPPAHQSGRKLWVPKRIALASAGPVRAAHAPHAEAMSTRTLDAPVRTAQRVTSRVSPAGACAGDRDGWGLPGRRRVDQPRAEAGGQ